MSKSIKAAAAVALVVAAAALLAMRGHEASAQSVPLYVNAVDIDVVPGEIDQYLAALKENAAAAVKQEPGCHTFDITVSQADPEPRLHIRGLRQRRGLGSASDDRSFQEICGDHERHGRQARGEGPFDGRDVFERHLTGETFRRRETRWIGSRHARRKTPPLPARTKSKVFVGVPNSKSAPITPPKSVVISRDLSEAVPTGPRLSR